MSTNPGHVGTGARPANNNDQSRYPVNDIPMLSDDVQGFEGFSGGGSTADAVLIGNGEWTFEHFVHSVRAGLFGILFVVIKESRIPPFLVFFSMAIDCLQMFNFSFDKKAGFVWSSAEWFHSLISLVSPNDVVTGFVDRTAAVATVLALMGVVAVNFFYVGWSFYRNHIRFIWTLKTLRTLLSFCVTFLYIPIISVLSKNFLRCYDTSGQPISCWTGTSLPLSIVCVVVGAPFVVVAFICQATFFEQEPGGKDALSRPHARVELIHLSVRTYLTLLFTTMRRPSLADLELHPMTPIESWVLVLSLVVTSSITCFSYAYYMPFFRFNYTLLQTALLASWNLSCLALLYVQLRPNAMNEMSILFFFLAPMYSLLIMSLQVVRRRWLLKVDVRKLTDPLSIELKARLLLEERGLLFKTNEAQLADGANLLADQVALFDKLKDVNALWSEAVKHLPDQPLLHLFWAEFYLLYLRNKPMAMTHYGRAEQMSSALDVQFLVFRRRKLLSENFAGDAIFLIAYEQHLNLAMMYQSRVHWAQIKFWSELLKKSPDMARLHALAETISQGISKTQENFVRVLKLNPNSAHPLRLYATFLIEVLNDQKSGRELQERADDLEDRDDGVEAEKKEGGLDLDLFSDDNAIITISGEYDKVGQILHANKKASNVLGYRRNELMTMNISAIVPAPFAEPHDAYMRRYLETGFSKIVERTRKVLARHKNGYLLKVMLAVKQISRQSATAFLGVLRPLPEDNEHYIIADDSDFVTGFTKGVTMWFRISPKEIQDGKKVHISQILPRFRELREEYQSSAGADTVFTAPDGRQMILEAQMSTTELPRPEGNGVLRMTMVVFAVTASAVDAKGVKGDASLQSSTSKPSESGSSGSSGPSRRHSVVGLSTVARKRDQAMGFMDSVADSQDELDSVMEASSDQGGGGTPDRSPKTRKTILKRNKSGKRSEVGNSTAKSSRSAVSAVSVNSPEYVKAVLVRKNMFVARNLRWLRWAFLSVIVILIALAVRGHFTAVSLYDQYAIRLVQITQEHSVAQHLVTLALAARTLDLVGLGQIPMGTSHVANATALLSDALTSISASLSALRQTMTDEAFYSQYFLSAKIEFVQFQAAPPNSTLLVGLIDAVNRVQSAASFVLASPTQVQQRHLDLITANGPFSLPKALMRHTLGFQNTFQSISDALTVEVGVSIMPVAVYVLTAVLIIQPIYTAIQQERDGFLGMFSSIPRHVIKAIQGQWIRRLEKLNGEEDSIDMSTSVGAPPPIDNGGPTVGSVRATAALSSSQGSLTAAHLPASITGGNGTISGNGVTVSAFSEGSANPITKSSMSVGASRIAFTAGSNSNTSGSSVFHLMGRSLSTLGAKLASAAQQKYLILLTLTTAYFLTSSLMAYSFQSRALSQSQEVKFSTHLSIYTRQITYFVREATVNLQTPLVSSALAKTRVLELNQLIEELTNTLVYGNVSLEVDGITKSSFVNVNELLMRNACVTPGSPEGCATFHNGMLSNGLVSAMREYNALATQALALLQNGGLLPGSVFSIEPFSTLWQLDMTYLPAALTQLSHVYTKKATDGLSGFLRMHLIITIVYVLLLVLLFALYYRPHLAQMGNSIMRKHVMLFLIPTEVIANVDSIQRYIKS